MKQQTLAKKQQVKPTIIDYGILSDSGWEGPVRVSDILQRLHAEPSQVNTAIADLESYYVPTSPSAKTRCIDGRPDPDFDAEWLGPQVPGGAPGAAIAYRLGVDSDDLTRGSYVSDAETMISLFLRFGMTPGGHRDEQAGQDTAGCGAIDRMDVMIALMTDPRYVEDHKRIVKLLLGKEFKRENYLQVLGAANLIHAHSAEYFRARDSVIAYLESRTKGSVATLKGEHNECLVIANLVPNTTLNSGRFLEENNGIQAFGYDMWRSKDIAQRILGRPDQVAERDRYVMARVMCSVATLMALTDGSQRLLLRLPTA